MEDGEELEFFIVIVFLKGGDRERELLWVIGLCRAATSQVVREFFPFDIGRV
jgi:hypothetical protein